MVETRQLAKKFFKCTAQLSAKGEKRADVNGETPIHI